MFRSDVLIYGMNYAPELTGVGRYSGELAEGLAGRGRRVVVVTTPPHYPGWFVRPPHRALGYRRERRGGVDVTRCPIVLHRACRGIWRLIAPLSFALSSAPVVLWRVLRDRPATVVCVEPTLFTAPAALLAAKFVGARTVLHVQDLEIDAAFAVGHLAGGGWLARLAEGFERFVSRRFDAVVTISERMAERLGEKGIAADRLSVVRNWVDTSRIFPLDGPSAYRRELGIADDAFVVLYAGQIGAKQALHVVFEAAERLADAADIVFVVAGEGPLKAEFAARYGHLPNLRLLGLQPEERLNEFLNLADCHVLPQDPAVKDLVLPSKLGGMLASGRPVLVVADDGSELATFIGDSCHRLPTAEAGALWRALRELAATRTAPDDDRRRQRLALASRLCLPDALDAFDRVLRRPDGHRATERRAPGQRAPEQGDPMHERQTPPGRSGFPFRHRLLRLVWGLVWGGLGRWTPVPLHGWRRLLLRAFGATIDSSALVYPGVQIWYPPNLTMGFHSCLGPDVNCYCMDRVVIGRDAVVSQGAHLCAGSHDIDSPDFALITRPIIVGERAWIAAEAFVGPGVDVGEGAVLGARAVAMRSLAAWTVYAGNPARAIRTRARAEHDPVAAPAAAGPTPPSDR
jgi:colanic acid biosynthesis glycosyl transferase WcaI